MDSVIRSREGGKLCPLCMQQLQAAAGEVSSRQWTEIRILVGMIQMMPAKEKSNLGLAESSFHKEVFETHHRKVGQQSGRLQAQGSCRIGLALRSLLRFQHQPLPNAVQIR